MPTLRAIARDSAGNAAEQDVQITVQASSGYVVPSNIDATGTQDVTAALNAFIASVPNGATVVFPAGAVYRCESIVRLNNRTGLTLLGNGATIKATTTGAAVPCPSNEPCANWPRTRSHIQIRTSNGIAIRNLKIQGPNALNQYTPDLEGQHGFDIETSDNVEIDSCEARYVWGDFVYTGQALGVWGHCRFIHVHDCYFDVNGRQGFGLTATDDMLIERNTILNVKRTMFDLEPTNPNDGGNRRVTIQDNTTGVAVNVWVALHGPKGFSENITIRRNTSQMRLRVLNSAVGNRHKNIRIEDNSSTEVATGPQKLMELYRVDGLVVRRNYQPCNRANMVGVYAAECCGVDIGDNVLAGPHQAEFQIIPYDCG